MAQQGLSSKDIADKNTLSSGNRFLLIDCKEDEQRDHGSGSTCRKSIKLC